MSAYGQTRKHGKVVGLLFYIGFFLLFCSLGTFGSAGLIAYQAAKWTETTAQIEDCSLGEYDRGTLYALRCAISYQIAGRTYKNSLHSHFTRSLRNRSEISQWIALNRAGSALMVRVNPSYPQQFLAQSHLPVKQGRNADEFFSAAILLGSLSLVLLGTARALVRRGL